MAPHRWQDQADEFEVPMTPLIDIIFILIVFFLVATTFYTDERDLKIKLPEGSEGDVSVEERNTFVINVREAGVLVVRNKIVQLAELEQELQGLVRQPKVPDVEIRGDAASRHGRIMEIMNLCKKTGIHNYSLTQRIVTETE